MKFSSIAFFASLVAQLPLGAPLATPAKPLSRVPKFLIQLDSFLDRLQERKEHLANHIYLNGNYAPVAEENFNLPVEVVEGKVPTDLDGLFVRNGPNPIPSQIKKRYHWFDGHGMLHNLRIKDGKATYSNIYIPTPRYLMEKELGKEWVGIGRTGDLTGFVGLLKLFLVVANFPNAVDMSPLELNQANTQTVMFNNKFYCCHESSFPFEIQLSEEGAIVKGCGHETFDNVLNYPVSAHPKRDFETGNFLFHSYAVTPADVERDGTLKVGEFNIKTGKVEGYFVPNPESTKPTFSHDIMFTKNWLIVTESSLVFAPEKMMEGKVFNWSDEQNMKVGLVPRGATDPAKVVWVDMGAPHIMIHAINAWEEEDGTVVMWSPVGDRMDMNIDSGCNTYYMMEVRMDPKTGAVEKNVISKEHNVEFSSVREDCYGRFCRYGYTGIMEPDFGGDGIFKGFVVWDMQDKKIHNTVFFREGDIGGEPVVIPKTGKSGSDEVYLGTFIYNSIDKSSYYVLYDIESGSSDPVVRLCIPKRVPFGFHGRWVTGDDLRAHVAAHNP